MTIRGGESLMSNLLGNWVIIFIITTALAYIIVTILFKASTIKKGPFIISYIVLVIILDVILILNRKAVSPELFKGLSIGLLMGMFFAVKERREQKLD